MIISLFLLRWFYILKLLKAIIANLYPEIGRLAYSEHINQLLISFIFALNQGFESPVFGIVHSRTLTIVTSAIVIEVRRLIYKDLAKFINE